MPNLSNDSDERVQLNSYRMIGGNLGYFVTASFTLPLVAFFGQGNDQKGFSLTVLVYGIIAALMFWFAFVKTKEVNTTSAQSLPIRDSFKAIKSNWPWVFAAFGTGIAVSMPFAMLSDTVDYGEWKNGIRASGFLTAIGSSFCIKNGSLFQI